jgi:hypothetical protein
LHSFQYKCKLLKAKKEVAGEWEKKRGRKNEEKKGALSL